jgi:hypothetical protein
MRLGFFLIVGLIVNTLFAVLYPAQIFGDDPLGLTEIRNDKLQQYYTVNGTGVISGYTDGELVYNDGIFTDLSDATSATEGDSGLFVGDLLTFIDWVKVGFNLIKTGLMFIIGFVFLLWGLVYPLNFLVGVPFSVLYMYSLASYIIGRGG